MMEQEIKEEIIQSPGNFPIKKKKIWLTIVIIILVVISLSSVISLAFWNNLLKNQIKTENKKQTNIVQYEAPKYDAKDKALFVRLNTSQINSRLGIWGYDFSKKEETQLISFQGILDITDTSQSDWYGNPSVSPDLTKIVFYLKSKGGTYNLWLYDLNAGKKQKLLEDVSLFKGYVQSPIWAKNSNLIYLTFYENGLNKLFSLDLKGNRKRLANSYSGQVFWPEFINDSLLIFNTSLPETSEIGILDLKNDSVSIIQTPTSAYLTKIEDFQDNALIKFPIDSYRSSSGPIEKTDIYGLERLDLKNLTADTFAVPKDIVFEPGEKRVQPLAVCHKKWILLETIKNDKQVIESSARYFVYNLLDGSAKEIKLPPKYDSIYNFNCDQEKDILYSQVSGNNLEELAINFANPNDLQVKDYSKLIPFNLSQTCLYAEQELLTADFLYISFRTGEACQGTTLKDKGIYRIGLKDNSVVRISFGENISEDDFPLTPH